MMKNYLTLILTLLFSTAYAQVRERWQAFVNTTYGAAPVGVVEFTPGSYTVFGNNCVDPRCQTRQPYQVVLDADGNIVSEAAMNNLTGQQFIALHKDDAGRHWLEATNQQQTTTFWHLVNAGGQVLKTFSAERYRSNENRLESNQDSTRSHLFKYPYGFYHIRKRGNAFSLTIKDTLGNTTFSRSFLPTDGSPDSIMIDYRFHYLKDGQFLISYLKTDTTQFEPWPFHPYPYYTKSHGNFIEKYGATGVRIFTKRTSYLANRDSTTMWTQVMPEGVQNNIIWATMNCNDEILIGGHTNLIIVDVMQPIPYTMVINSIDGSVIGRQQGFLPPYDGNVLHRPLNYNCQYNQIQFNEGPRYFPPVDPFGFGGTSHNQCFIINNPFIDSTYRFNGFLHYMELHSSSKGTRAIMDWYAYPTTTNLIRTSDKGYLLATFNSQVIGHSPIWGTLYDTVSYMQIIKYDSLGRTTNVESVKASQPTQALRIVPNPATHSITFPGVGNGILTLVDPNGKVWLKREMATNQSLDISALPAGLYTARLQTAKGLQLQGRFAKE